MKIRTIIKDQNGATAVEFALILPLLILILFGITEFSLLLYNKHIITNSCREGARAGIIVGNPDRLTNDEIVDIVETYAQSYLITFGSDKLDFVDDNADIKIASIDDGDPDNGGCVCSSNLADPNWWINEERCLIFGCDLRVEVNYKYEFLVLSSWLGPIDLRAVSTMRME